MADAPTPPSIRVLLDTNVVLDLLLRREPWLSAAKAMWDARDAKTIIAHLPTVALTNIFYIGRKQIGNQRVMEGIRYCVANFVMAPVDGAVVDHALTLTGADFEDNVQIACAVAAAVDYIVTRDPDGFAHSPVRAVSPSELVSMLSSK